MTVPARDALMTGALAAAFLAWLITALRGRRSAGVRRSAGAGWVAAAGACGAASAGFVCAESLCRVLGGPSPCDMLGTNLHELRLPTFAAFALAQVLLLVGLRRAWAAAERVPANQVPANRVPAGGDR